MRWEQLGEQNCSVARSLSVFGDRWTLLILRDSFLGIKRFDDFMDDLKLSRTILTDRLNKLVEHDVLIKVPYQTKPTRYDYKLTEKGRALHPVILAIVQWGDTFYAEDGEPPVLRTHKKCGHDFQAIVVCSECSEPIKPQDVTVRVNRNSPAYKRNALQKA
ncbi:MAG: helix-turn-helix transcriptional regulator [Sneathiella sp.]|nr:helix-turn-helix transcriptional regulator [Sneathiella sp.]